MKKIFHVIICFISMTALAQTPEAMEKIEAARIALITERLELSPEQAEKFWPIYREYSEKQKSLRKEFIEARKEVDPDNASEAENKQLLEFGQNIKQQQLDLEKKYSDRILQVISSRQLNNLRQAEQDFKEMLLKRLRAQQQRREQQRSGQRLQDRRN